MGGTPLSFYFLLVIFVLVVIVNFLFFKTGVDVDQDGLSFLLVFYLN
jgi:hypothetical protein